MEETAQFYADQHATKAPITTRIQEEAIPLVSHKLSKTTGQVITGGTWLARGVLDTASQPILV